MCLIELIQKTLLSQPSKTRLPPCLTLHSHVAEVKDGRQQPADFPGVVVCEGEDLQSRAEVGVLLDVITSLAPGAVPLVVGSDR